MTWTSLVVSEPQPTGGLISSFSSYGLPPDLSFKPDIGAPGGTIRSTLPLEQGGYGNISGTSMSSPHVAGAVALLLEARPHAPPGRGAAASAEHGAAAAVVGQPGARLARQRPSPGRGHAADRRCGAGRRDRLAEQPRARRDRRPAPSRSGSASLWTMATTAAITITGGTNTTGTATTTMIPSPTRWATSRRSSTGAEHVHAVVPPRFRERGVQRADRHARRRPQSITATPARSTSRSRRRPRTRQRGCSADTSSSRQTTAAPVLRVPYAGYNGDYQAIQVLTPTPAGFPWLAKLVGTSLFNQPNGATFTLQGDDVPFILRTSRSSAADAETRGHRSVDRRIRGLRRHRGVPAAQQFGDGLFRSDVGWHGHAPARRQAAAGGRRHLPDRTDGAEGARRSDNAAHTEHWTSPDITIDRP